jgi:hypothetical protein
MNEGRRFTASVDELHPDITEAASIYGSHHTTGGRILTHHRTGASHAEQEARMSDQRGWNHHSTFTPVRFAIEGARSYASQHGLADPHQHGFDHIRQDADTVRSVGRTYDKLPEHDPSALKHFHAMGHEVAKQFDHLTNRMGINVQTVDHDPYKNVHELVSDLHQNKRLQVMGTHATGGHPFFSNEDNDKFRAVHDFFGHAATGRDFDRHGEEAAYVAHAKMFSDHARPALASETRGQNASLILNGHFGPQKVALLPGHMHSQDVLNKHLPRLGKIHRRGSVAVLPDGRVALAVRIGDLRKLAHDSGDGETIFHCPFCGSGQVIARNDGTTECEFCSTAFTVQVQPQMPAFPQTIDGVPVDVPGMPAGGANANVPAGGDPMMDPNADPAAEDEGSPFGGNGEDTLDEGSEDESGDGDLPDFMKKSYLTHTGAVLNRDQYMRHLALAHLPNRERVLSRIRHENGGA